MITVDAIEAALADGQLLLHYQPKISMTDGCPCGAEALIRWQQPDGTLIQPDDFIPVAESHGLLEDITINLLEQAVAAIAVLQPEHPAFPLSMNVTPHDLESHIISDHIDRYLEAGAIRAVDLQIEITESAAMSNFDRVYDDLVRLSERGIHVLMDDFGTGYSSIDRLSQLPFNAVKLDKGVVGRMSTSRQNLNVVRSSISMARELRMSSVAEGVESEGAYNFLLAHGCEEAQGFWISKPLTLPDLLAFLGRGFCFRGSQLGRLHLATHNIASLRKTLVDTAFCSSINSADVMDTLIDTQFATPPEQSRFGVWYYGEGQSLSQFDGYREMESIYLELYGYARRYMQSVSSGADTMTLSTSLLQFDAAYVRLSAGLQQLERELLKQAQPGHRATGDSAVAG